MMTSSLQVDNQETDRGSFLYHWPALQGMPLYPKSVNIHVAQARHRIPSVCFANTNSFIVQQAYEINTVIIIPVDR